MKSGGLLTDISDWWKHCWY